MPILCDITTIKAMMNEDRFRHYRTGIEHQDQQHWKLLSELSSLVQCLSDKEDDSMERLDKLVTHLDRHFIDESDHMRAIGYPYIDHHTSDHNKMVRRIREAVNQPSTYFASMRAHDLEEMFLEHITYYDMQYVDWEKNQRSVA